MVNRDLSVLSTLDVDDYVQLLHRVVGNNFKGFTNRQSDKGRVVGLVASDVPQRNGLVGATTSGKETKLKRTDSRMAVRSADSVELNGKIV